MAKTYKQIMDEARQIVPEVSPEQVKARLDKGEHPVVLDVREKEEVRQGYVPGALSLPRGFLEMRVEEAVPDKNTPIVAYCGSGTRSLLAGRILKELGYTNVVSMRGGRTARKNKGLPVKEDRQFTPEQQIRYSRHFLLPEVGEKGQAKLLDARVLCIGAGGLGSPAAFYLAAAAVGTLGSVDMAVADRLLPAPGAVLPLPLPRAAAARGGAVVRRGGRARRAAGAGRLRAGARGDQADPRPGHAAHRAHDALRHALGRGAHAAAPPRPQVRGVRRTADGDEAHRLRDVLRARGHRRQRGRAGRRAPLGAGAAATVGCVKHHLGPQLQAARSGRTG